MNVVEALLIAFSVSLDAFALSVSGALTCRREETAMCALKAAGFFGGFQFFMPLVGFYAAALLEDAVEKYDHWIAFALLAAVGGKMVVEALSGGEKSEKPCASAGFFRCKNLIVPAIATSIDALAVGAGIAFSGAPIWMPAILMGVVTGGVCASGVWLGSRAARFAEARVMSAIGGSVIILIGANILRQHLCGG